MGVNSNFGGDISLFGKRFYQEYLDSTAYGEEIGLKVFFGVEVSTRLYDNVHILIFGVGPEFVYENPEMYDYTQEQLYLAAKKHGGTVVQAHPFRRDMEVVDWKLLDGYEIFNGNPRHYSSNEMAEEWAKYHNKSLVLSGSDFHEIEDAGIGGVYFQKEIKTNEELLEELKAGRYRVRKVDFKHTREE